MHMCPYLCVCEWRGSEKMTDKEIHFISLFLIRFFKILRLFFFFTRPTLIIKMLVLVSA